MYKSIAVLFAILALTPLAAGNQAITTVPGPDGRLIDRIVVPGIPAEQRIPGPVASPSRNAVMLSGVPAFDWSYGCSATSAAMIAGYYDRGVYSCLYTGPVDGGTMPLDNSIWGSGECPLSATHQYYDGRWEPGHVDRFWTNNSGDDPYGAGDPTPTYGGCTADYMGTNQQWWGCSDGATTFAYYVDGSPLHDPADGSDGPPYFRDGIHGLRLFFESRGYSVGSNFNQYIQGWDGNTSGYTLQQYQASIAAGIPVMIQIEGHSMVGVGYESGTNTIYVHNTWDYELHSMEWGGVYSGMAHYGVGVIALDPPVPPAISLSDGDLSAVLPPDSEGMDTITINNTGSGPLCYTIQLQELRLNGEAATDRSIAGSTLTLNATQYAAGGSYRWTFSLFNASTDDEWLKQASLDFPAGVTVVSTSNFVGGGGGDMVPDLSSGDGITVTWFGESSGGWGVVYPGNTATAQVVVQIDEGFSGSLQLPWQITGDVYGSEPHSLSGAITLAEIIPPISWFELSSSSGFLLSGQSHTLTGGFSSAGLAPGSYSGLASLVTNSPLSPVLSIPISLTVLGPFAAPEITSILSTPAGTTVSWNPVPHALHYRIYRSLDPYTGFSLATETTTTSWLDPQSGPRAFYRVSATD